MRQALLEGINGCGRTRYEISKATGIPQSVLFYFVNGHRGLTLDTADVLAEYLGLELRPMRKSDKR